MTAGCSCCCCMRPHRRLSLAATTAARRFIFECLSGVRQDNLFGAVSAAVHACMLAQGCWGGRQPCGARAPAPARTLRTLIMRAGAGGRHGAGQDVPNDCSAVLPADQGCHGQRHLPQAAHPVPHVARAGAAGGCARCRMQGCRRIMRGLLLHPLHAPRVHTLLRCCRTGARSCGTGWASAWCRLWWMTRALTMSSARCRWEDAARRSCVPVCGTLCMLAAWPHARQSSMRSPSAVAATLDCSAWSRQPWPCMRGHAGFACCPARRSFAATAWAARPRCW